MTGTLAELALAAIVLVVSHFGISSTALRDRLIAGIGLGPYRGIYSLIAAAAITWLVMAYNRAPADPVLWWLGDIGAYVSIVFVPIALLLAVAGVSGRNPTSVGRERELEDDDPAIGVLRITRNPLMWGIGIWALTHVLATGELRAVILFGALAVLSLVGTVLIDLKYHRRRPPAYERFAAATSNLPFLAVIDGRQSLTRAAREIGWIRMAVTVGLYAVLLHGHTWLFGISPYPIGW